MQWLNLLILFFAFGLPAITWAISKLKEQMEIKRAKEAEQRRREEMLRTGRVDVEEAQVAATETAQQARARELRELAAKRQAQIRRIREQQRQQQQQQRGQTPQPNPPRTPTAGSGGGTPPRPGIPYQNPPARPPAVSTPPPPLAAVEEIPVHVSIAERSKARTETRRRENEERRARRLAEQDVRLGRRRKVATPAVPISTPQMRVSRREMRRAVVLAEVLGAPVSMREEF